MHSLGWKYTPLHLFFLFCWTMTDRTFNRFLIDAEEGLRLRFLVARGAAVFDGSSVARLPAVYA